MWSWLQGLRHRNDEKNDGGMYTVPVLRRYASTEQDRCVGCGLCAEVCPSEAIQVTASYNKDKTVNVESFFVDMDICVQCNLCVDACPMRAIDFVKTHKPPKRSLLTKKDLTSSHSHE